MSAKKRDDEKKSGAGCCGCGGCPGCLLALSLLLLITVMVWHMFKPLPDGLSMEGPLVDVPASDIRVLADISAVDLEGNPVISQEIFDRMLVRIGAARELVLLDNFLFNTITGNSGEPFRRLCDELTNALVSAKVHHPDMPIVVITDPINTVYGGSDAPHLRVLENAGIHVVLTDLKKLRDSNTFYSAWWRLGPRWFAHPSPGGSLPNPFDATESKVGIRSWLSLLNFKANHRKVLMTDDGEGRWGVIIGSLNAHDGSSRHSNLALEVTSTALAQQVWASEAVVLKLSGTEVPISPVPEPFSTAADTPCRAGLLTEKAILEAILESIDLAGQGDTVDGAFFYLSHRAIRQALVDAAARGAEIRLIMDPSKDAFGRTKNGIPNRQAGLDLMTRGQGRITVRWYQTHGEQFHPKMVVIRCANESTIILGSANMTRRNLDELNLESNLKLQCKSHALPDAELQKWFNRLWFNQEVHATVDFETFEDRSRLRQLLADVQERTGLGTF